MQFFEYEGIIVERKIQGLTVHDPKERDGRRIARETASFVKKLDTKMYIFVSDIDGNAITMGVISEKSLIPDNYVKEFLKALKLNVKNIYGKEISFGGIGALLNTAEYGKYIRDDMVIYKYFGIEILTSWHNTSIDFNENMAEEINKKNIYKNASQFFSADTFLPELDRIYLCKNDFSVSAHPIHYMLETDDDETRTMMYKSLISALYAQKRLRIQRYCVVDISYKDNFSLSSCKTLYKMMDGGAVVLRFNISNDEEDDHANCCREIIKKTCESAKNYHNRVLTIFCLPRECTRLKEIFFDYLPGITVAELKEEFADYKKAISFLKMIAKNNNEKTDKKLFNKLEADKTYLAPDLHLIFDEWFDLKVKQHYFPQYENFAAIGNNIKDAPPKGNAYTDLMEMVGLNEAKKVINQALDYSKAKKLYADKGMKNDCLSMHMIFSGNPGTAKTSVARLFARIMKDNGILSKGELIEVGRGDLVGKYVGWTAKIIKEKFTEAEGNVLFIDEAYSLVDDRNGSFGDEAINTIVQEMENHRKDVIVIFAGYPDKMEEFLQKNPGLRSRIAFHVPFEDYNTDELCNIAKLISEKYGLSLTDEAMDKLYAIFNSAKNQEDFGNGRYVRNIIEKAKLMQASRLLKLDYNSITKSDIETLCAEDIEEPIIKHIKKLKKVIGFCG